MAGLRVDCNAYPQRSKGQGVDLACRQHECQTGLAKERLCQGHMALQEDHQFTADPPRAEHIGRSSVYKIRLTSACRPYQQEQGSPRLAPFQCHSNESVQCLGLARAQ